MGGEAREHAMTEEIEQQTTRRARGVQGALFASVSAFAVSSALTLALVTYWIGLWGSDVLGIEIAVPEGLALLLSFCAVLAVILLRSYRVQLTNARLEGELRATRAGPPADFNLRIEGGKALRGDEETPLTPQEFRLLQCLIAREGEVCDYEYIIEEVWPEESHSDLPPGRDSLAALVRRLRDKVNVHDYIKNHPGRGYELVQWEC
jgi:hypothetical protein